MNGSRRWFALALFFALLVEPAAGQVPEIRLARQFSMGYLQFNVMEHQQLIESHARALGLPQIKVSWVTFNGPAAVNEALLSGSVDIAAGGTPGLLVLWSRTKGTPQEVRGISAMSSQPFLLNTRNPAIKTVADFSDADRIAVPAVKVSIQAIALQMAAAKAFGPANFAKLDPLTVSMAPPDATIALLSGAGEVNSVFSVPPFQQQQLEKPGITTVLNSYDVMDAPHSFTVAWTSARFRDRNPILYKALMAAMTEATDIVNRERRAAAALWIADSNSKLPLDFVERVVSGPQVRWTLVPENTMKFARFMQTTGMLKVAPESWRDYFFPEIHALNGS
ncbi:MAG: sulfonate transport system substrate-binding protein [Gammaproteobacteria bacterium]|nr:sulfonate transport system substrate-binding protein [Gammaproteobacteria bacterium]